jgi:hypothetical protein
LERGFFLITIRTLFPVRLRIDSHRVPSNGDGPEGDTVANRNEKRLPDLRDSHIIP